MVKVLQLDQWACASWHSSRAMDFIQHGMVLLNLSGYDCNILQYILHATSDPYHLSLPCYRVPGSKLPTSKNYLYFLKFVHIHVALHRTIPNHLKLCPYDEKWPSYEAHNSGTRKFSNFDFIPKKAASPGLLQTAINTWMGRNGRNWK